MQCHNINEVMPMLISLFTMNYFTMICVSLSDTYECVFIVHSMSIIRHQRVSGPDEQAARMPSHRRAAKYRAHGARHFQVLRELHLS